MENTIVKYNYKDSGIEWLGQIPEHWEVKKLKHFGKIYAGLNGKKGDDFNKEYFPNAKEFVPFTTIANYSQIRDERFQYVKVSDDELQNQVFKNDLLFLMSSETMTDIAKSSVYLLDKPAFLNSFCKGFRLLSKDINSIYANYLLNSITYRKYYELCGRGFTRINIKQEYINDTPFTLPPLHEQKAIANFLDKKTSDIDKLIHLKNQQIDLLKEHRQGIIHTAVTKGLNKQATFKDSGIDWIGQIPEHWDVKKVKYLFKLITQTAPLNNNYELLSVYTDIGVKPRKELEERGNKASSTDGYWMVKKEDIIVNKLLAWMGAIGISEYEGVTSPAYDILRRTNTQINPYYYHNLFRTQQAISEFKKHSRGIMEMRLRLYFDKLGQIIVPLPPLAEQAQIVAYLEEQTALIDQAIAQKEAQIAELKAYKQSLINEVVTGKINIL